MTLAHVAAREGHLTCLQTLVDHNIDVSTEDKGGRSPADYAYAAGQTGCGRYLVMEESCWLLSVRVAKLHRELKDCKDENKELRQRLEASLLFRLLLLLLLLFLAVCMTFYSQITLMRTRRDRRLKESKQALLAFLLNVSLIWKKACSIGLSECCKASDVKENISCFVRVTARVR